MSACSSVLAVASLVAMFAACAAANAPSDPGIGSDEPATTSRAAASGPSVEPTVPALPSSEPDATVREPSGSAPGSGATPAWTTTIDNRWFPLVPGRTFTYHGTKDGKQAIETVKVTAATKVVGGVTCVVVQDDLSLAGVPSERLLGYYAQDGNGSVLLFGEDAQELDANGHVVSTDGSWHAGVDRAKPALVMEGSPVVGHTFAHDATRNDFAVLSLSQAVTVPFGSFSALVTKEWSPDEPDVETHKFYAPDVGLVRDVAVKGPSEELLLVTVGDS